MADERRRALRVNRHLFTETGTDSGSLNVLGTLVHQFPDEGDYVVEVSREGEPVGRRMLVVDDDYRSMQADFDLAAIARGDDRGCGCDRDGVCTCEAQAFVCIREEGYAVFHVSSGPGGYEVRIASLQERDVQEFDGTELTEYDTFAAVLMRPGTYALRNPVTGDEGEVEVVYPDPERAREAIGQPVEVEVDDGFAPASVELHPGQGLVFDVEAPARIEIELTDPHEDATEDPVPGDLTVRRPPRSPETGGQRVRARFDPGELSVDELEAEIESVTSPLELRALLLAERRDRDRRTVAEAIRRRLRDVRR